MASESRQRLRYIGPHDAVEVLDPSDGTVHLVERNKEKTFPSELAKTLLEQKTNWERAKAS